MDIFNNIGEEEKNGVRNYNNIHINTNKHIINLNYHLFRRHKGYQRIRRHIFSACNILRYLANIFRKSYPHVS